MNTETVTETVTADQLSVGDRVLAFGLEVKVAFIGNVSLELEANGSPATTPAGEFFLWILARRQTERQAA